MGSFMRRGTSRVATTTDGSHDAALQRYSVAPRDHSRGALRSLLTRKRWSGTGRRILVEPLSLCEKGLYWSAYRQFRTEANFSLHYTGMSVLQYPVGFSELDLTKIRHLTFFAPLGAVMEMVSGHSGRPNTASTDDIMMGYKQLSDTRWACASLRDSDPRNWVGRYQHPPSHLLHTTRSGYGDARYPLWTSQWGQHHELQATSRHSLGLHLGL
ncbi:hypothetical protein LTR56_010026 [Elasticomyces elasticus]|nr:hypothetical protein LTR56_010026 [Elasticomyces elasticus]KAK3665036.1 hypothetical protein LTR22_004090 [Elasticomyces elasticus]KAK4931588.1 hypothetical protein LTR49_001978 [Elasticomyces elasticus]KAK5766747.1 hypothetical protein LTS12_003098 [Elasticomyces elasticus]